MIYFLVHLGGAFPGYIEYTVRQIHKKDHNCEIILCGDINPDIKGYSYTFINSKNLDITTNDTYLINDPNPLWRNSLLRIFAINSFMQKENIEGIIHFDNDVMIYDNFYHVLNFFDKKNYITPHKSTEYTFGFSYLNNRDNFNELVSNIQRIISKGEREVRNLTGDEVHEMRLLNFCGNKLLENLPVHPELGNINNFIFDPSSYGQYIDGTPNGHAPGFIDNSQLVGSYFKSAPHIHYNKEEDIYLYTHNNKDYKIFNLHVHSKNLNHFYHEI